MLNPDVIRITPERLWDCERAFEVTGFTRNVLWVFSEEGRRIGYIQQNELHRCQPWWFWLYVRRSKCVALVLRADRQTVGREIAYHRILGSVYYEPSHAKITVSPCAKCKVKYSHYYDETDLIICRKCSAKTLTVPMVSRVGNARRALRQFLAPGETTANEWLAIKEFFGNKCLRCGSSGELTKDHVLPLTKGGSNWPDNIQPLCRSCNSWKGTKHIDFRPDANSAPEMVPALSYSA